MTKIKERESSAAELAHVNEPVVLLVLARERPAVARALLDAAAEAGADPHVVASTSDGYVVPRHLAELAGLVLAEDVAPLEGRPVYAAAPATEQPAPRPAEAETVDDQPVDDVDQGAGRRRAGKGGK